MDIKIPKGALVFSTHPVNNKVIQTRNHTVSITNNKKLNRFLVISEITWAGSGGYWRWTAITPKLLELNPELAEYRKCQDNENGWCIKNRVITCEGHPDSLLETNRCPGYSPRGSHE